MQYDGTGKLNEAVAELYGLSSKSQAQIAELNKQAKAALNITSKAKVLPDDDRLAIYRWHVGRLNADNAVQADMLGEALDDTIAAINTIDTGEASSGSPMPLEPSPPTESDNIPMVAIEPTGTAIEAQPMTTTNEPQRSGNWGGVRQGSGRKATGKQTVTVRVPVALAGIIKQLKGIGDTQGQAALLAVISGLESALHNSRHTPKA